MEQDLAGGLTYRYSPFVRTEFTSPYPQGTRREVARRATGGGGRGIVARRPGLVGGNEVAGVEVGQTAEVLGVRNSREDRSLTVRVDGRGEAGVHRHDLAGTHGGPVVWGCPCGLLMCGDGDGDGGRCWALRLLCGCRGGVGDGRCRGRGSYPWCRNVVVPDGHGECYAIGAFLCSCPDFGTDWDGRVARWALGTLCDGRFKARSAYWGSHLGPYREGDQSAWHGEGHGLPGSTEDDKDIEEEFKGLESHLDALGGRYNGGSGGKAARYKPLPR